MQCQSGGPPASAASARPPKLTRHSSCLNSATNFRTSPSRSFWQRRLGESCSSAFGLAVVPSRPWAGHSARCRTCGARAIQSLPALPGWEKLCRTAGAWGDVRRGIRRECQGGARSEVSGMSPAAYRVALPALKRSPCQWRLTGRASRNGLRLETKFEIGKSKLGRREAACVSTRRLLLTFWLLSSIHVLVD